MAELIMSAHDLREVITYALADLPTGKLAVGLSGGLDSCVLLHALASLPEIRQRGLRTIHIDHALHLESPRWAKQCKNFAHHLDVPLTTLTVEVKRDAGLGLEAAARQARYAAFAANLMPGEILAFAHHRDDQVETVLLKLLRGAGPEGLGAMRPLRHFEHGFIWRPFLSTPRTLLKEYAHAHHLHWIEDPSNTNVSIDRNFLRLEILPRLRERWPQADIAIAHSTHWARHASDFIDTQTTQALAHLQGPIPNTLRWNDWLNLPDALRDPVLRYWLRTLDLSEPNHAHVAELTRQLSHAHADRLPCVRWPGVELRRYRDLLYAMQPIQQPPDNWETEWDGQQPLLLPAKLGHLKFVHSPTHGKNTQPFFMGKDVISPLLQMEHLGERARVRGQAYRTTARVQKTQALPPHPNLLPQASLGGEGIEPVSFQYKDVCKTQPARGGGPGGGEDSPLLHVRFRRGGENLRLPNQNHSRELRDLFQQRGVPPWERSRLPLLFDAEKTLLAVGDLCLSQAGQARIEHYQCHLLWVKD